MTAIHPTPSGTRDVLPDELREVHAIEEAVRGVFAARGYGEIRTPALEYEQVLTRGDPAAAEPAYKLFDEQGNVLVLRSDMTIPIARVVGTRYATASPPLRFCYVAHAYRSVRPQRGQDREMLQAGIELVGVPAHEGTAETLAVLSEVLDAVGLTDYRIGLGDASLYPALLDAHGVPAPARAAILHELVTRDFVGLEREVEGLRLGAEATAALIGVPQARGGPEVLDHAGAAADGLRTVLEHAPGRRARPRDPRPRPRAVARLLHGRGVRGLRRRAGRPARRRRPLRRPARPLRPRPARRGLGAQRRAAAHRARRRAPGGAAVSLGGLRLAVPRGALMRDTLDLLDALGVDTAEVRANDRKLLFEDAGLITMRPSDVPTYVEAGAADLGITGKDVLAEQSERAVYELLDLRQGPCVMVVASTAGEDRLDEALRRLGVMRVATKYPRIAARHFERTGRQAEIVEVKGSVELAPLTGLAEGIVDLTATGTTLRENGLVIREEILASTARLIANPVAHKLRAAAIDDVVERIRAVLAR